MKITLKQKKLTSGKYSLFIEYYKGKIQTPDGKSKHNRDFEYLKKYIHENPTTAKEKKENKEALAFAENVLSIRKAEYAQGKYGIKDHSKGNLLFLDYFNEKKDERYNETGNFDNWNAAQVHLEAYCPPNLTFSQVDENFVKGFKNYLDKKAKTKSDTPLSQNTKYTYYNKFKACINAAFEDGYITQNPIKKVKSFEMAESQREYLTYDELQALANTECKYQILKNAFIFSCLTGIRWSDIDKMIWSEVREEKDDKGEVYYRIVFRQKKTDGLEYLDISSQARSLLGERRILSDKVFYRLKYGQTYNAEIVNWCNRAGITKHITFHSARHTHAVLLLENNADIYTVSKRLGHRELRTTEIYAKIIDKKMKEAASIIPELKIEL